MRIGVGVEGPSDRVFWDKVLHKHFAGVQFDIRNMKTREQLIRQTPRQLASFCSLHEFDPVRADKRNSCSEGT